MTEYMATIGKIMLFLALSKISKIVYFIIWSLWTENSVCFFVYMAYVYKMQNKPSFSGLLYLHAGKHAQVLIS